MWKKLTVVTLTGLFLAGVTTGAATAPEEKNNTVVIDSPEEKQSDRRSEHEASRKATVQIESVDIPYDTTIIEDSTLPEGVEIVAREGVEGKKAIYRSYTERIQTDGTLKMVPVQHSDIAQSAVNKIVRQGTKNSIVPAMSDIALEREAQREQERAAEARAEREAEQEAAEEARRAAIDATRDANSSSDDSSSDDSSDANSTSSGGSAEVDTSGSAAAMKAQVQPGQTTTPEQNRAYAKAILSPADFEAADILINRESRWITTAANPTSSAYGVPQSLPGNKMASAGSDWRTNGMTQFDWMITYVEQRYGSFQNALQHSHNKGWY